ncbi:MAG: GMC family oxidoreductase, partial [Stellaceae bacterium]
HLRQFGIAPVLDLPGVGSNLQDHLAVTLSFARREPSPFRALMRADRAARAMAQAYLFGTGPATALPGGATAFLRTRDGLAVPDIQFFLRGTALGADLWFPGWRKPYADAFTITPVLLHPEARGRLYLRSADPKDKVRIVHNFLTRENDLRSLRGGIRLARNLARQPALARWRGAELVPGEAAETDTALDQWVRRMARSAHHPSCSCTMAGPDAPLDPDLRVKGIDRLRVVDASAMPDLVSGNINACVLMIAEKASDLIRGRPNLMASATADALTPSSPR